MRESKSPHSSLTFCVKKPSVLPPDRGVLHEIDLVSGTKYCVTRQWPLPKEQCDVIDEFFRAKHAVVWCVRVNLRTLHSPSV